MQWGQRVILGISWMIVQKMNQVWQKFTNFLRWKSLTLIFFKIFVNKTSIFISNLNYWCSEDSFEVLHVSLAQKLTNLKFSPVIFFSLPSVTLRGCWGQTNSLSDLIRVSNESWISQLLYEMLIVVVRWKLWASQSDV